MKNRLFIVFTQLLTGLVLLQAQSNATKLVTADRSGKLHYTPYTTKGDILPDFSFCGYMRGEVSLPQLPVVATCSPSATSDDSPFIQAKIDSLAKCKPDQNGFRGAILLRSGLYRIANTIRITAGGIVLRGESNQNNKGTLLLAVSPRKYNVIEIGLNTKRYIQSKTEKPILDNYVPSGTTVMHVKNAGHYFAPDDQVVIIRPSTADWIHTIGMDSIPPRPLKGETTLQSMERFRKEGKNAQMNGTVEWTANSKNLYFERTIVSVNGDEIRFDIPLTNALQKEFGGARIAKYTFERIAQCGVENLSGQSLFDNQVKSTYGAMQYFSDEKHANVFISCNAVENSWIRDVNVEHFDQCVNIGKNAKFITSQDLSANNPVSIITGGRRYPFGVSGQMALFKRCYADGHRHVFVLGSSVAGPNAFVDGMGENTYASSEPHQRWATGCLFDNLTLNGPDASFMAVNRGMMGSGHGWAGAQMVFWNCSAPLIFVMQPPTAQNFAIGFKPRPLADKEKEKKIAISTIKTVNNASLSNQIYINREVNGDGWIESPDQIIKPLSLYYSQLFNRLGMAKTKTVLSKNEYSQFLPGY